MNLQWFSDFTVWVFRIGETFFAKKHSHFYYCSRNKQVYVGNDHFIREKIR